MNIWKSIKAWRRKHLRTPQEASDDMIAEFTKRFPGKCIICSFHRFGYVNAMTGSQWPDKHDCIESQPDPLSQCCGMPPLGEIFNDFAICSGCKEQADFSPQEE